MDTWNEYLSKKIWNVEIREKMLKIDFKKLPKIIEWEYPKNPTYDNAKIPCWPTTNRVERLDKKFLLKSVDCGTCQIKLHQLVTMATATANFCFLCYLQSGYRVLLNNTLHWDKKPLIKKFASKWPLGLNFLKISICAP